MPDTDPNPSSPSEPRIPGGGGPATRPDHPTSSIPLPAHGFARLDEVDELPVRELAELPAAEVVTRAAVTLMSASAEKLGLAPGGAPNLDLAAARVLITALAGLLASVHDDLGTQREQLIGGLRTLQTAFRETSSHPDAPGQGPGESLLR